MMIRRIALALTVLLVSGLAGCSGDRITAPQMDDIDQVTMEKDANSPVAESYSPASQVPDFAGGSPDTTTPPVRIERASWGLLKVIFSDGKDDDGPPKGDD